MNRKKKETKQGTVTMKFNIPLNTTDDRDENNTITTNANKN